MSIRIRSIVLSFTACLATLACEAEPEPRELGVTPRSLEGTEIDGRFRFDRDGELVFDDQARQAFDYFLTADGELSPEELQTWVEASLRAELGDGPAHAQAMAYWDSYLLFRAEAAATLENPAVASDEAAVEQRLLATLDAQLGGTPFAAAERERIERGFALHRAMTLADPDARAAELVRLDAAEAEAFAQTRAGRFLAGRRAIAEAQTEGADAQTLAALREQHFDAIEPGAAERLAALDAKRAAWDRRVAEFEAAQAELLASGSADVELAIAELEAEWFSEAERRRLHAVTKLRASN